MERSSAVLLRQLNLKNTPKRRAMMEILAEEPRYLTPDEVWQQMRARFGKIGLPTVYRNLDELSAGGVISRILHPDRKLYYFYCPNKDHHHHFFCVACRRVADVENCPAEGAEEEIQLMGGTLLSHVVQLSGLCSSCTAQEKAG